MKRLILYIGLCLPFSPIMAQQGVVFKVKYLPNHNYNMSVKMGIKINATISGDQQLIEKLNSQGIKQPVNVDVQAGVNGSTQTGSLKSDQTFPLNMEYKLSDISLTVNGKQFPVPPKITENSFKTIATMGLDGKMKVDSVGGKKVNDTANLKMQQMMDLVQKEIKFPERPLKPGDSFTQEMPIKIPVGSKNDMQLNGGVTYKLVSIAEGRAYFDVMPNISMTFKAKTTTVSITGGGSGKMVYSIKDNYPLLKDGNFNIKIKVTSDKINIDASAAINTSYICTIN